MFKCKHENIEEIKDEPHKKRCRKCKKVLHLEAHHIVTNKFNGYEYRWVNYDYVIYDIPQNFWRDLRDKVIIIWLCIFEKIKKRS